MGNQSQHERKEDRREDKREDKRYPPLLQPGGRDRAASAKRRRGSHPPSRGEEWLVAVVWRSRCLTT